MLDSCASDLLVAAASWLDCEALDAAIFEWEALDAATFECEGFDEEAAAFDCEAFEEDAAAFVDCETLDAEIVAFD